VPFISIGGGFPGLGLTPPASLTRAVAGAFPGSIGSSITAAAAGVGGLDLIGAFQRTCVRYLDGNPDGLPRIIDLPFGRIDRDEFCAGVLKSAPVAQLIGAVPVVPMPAAMAAVGATPMSAPFLPMIPSLVPTFSAVAPGAIGASMPDSFLGTLLNAVPGILTNLAQAGVIRGAVGQALAPMAMMGTPIVPGMQMVPGLSDGTAAFANLCNSDPTGTCQRNLALALTGGAPGIMSNPLFFSPTPAQPSGSMIGDLMNLVNGIIGPVWTGGQTGCGRSAPPMQAPTLFRTNACGKTSLPARQQVIGPDGQLYVIASLGRATRGAREESTMRRLARQNGFTVARKGSTRSTRRRRSPR